MSKNRIRTKIRRVEEYLERKRTKNSQIDKVEGFLTTRSDKPKNYFSFSNKQEAYSAAKAVMMPLSTRSPLHTQRIYNNVMQPNTTRATPGSIVKNTKHNHHFSTGVVIKKLNIEKKKVIKRLRFSKAPPEIYFIHVYNTNEPYTDIQDFQENYKILTESISIAEETIPSKNIKLLDRKAERIFKELKMPKILEENSIMEAQELEEERSRIVAELNSTFQQEKTTESLEPERNEILILEKCREVN